MPRRLDRLAIWLLRFATIVALDPPDGIVIDATGADYLHGGETAMLDGLIGLLAMSGVNARAAIADTWARRTHWPDTPHDRQSSPPRHGQSVLEALPLSALRIAASAVERLRTLGFERIGDLLSQPRVISTGRTSSPTAKASSWSSCQTEKPTTYRAGPK